MDVCGGHTGKMQVFMNRRREMKSFSTNHEFKLWRRITELVQLIVTVRNIGKAGLNHGKAPALLRQ